MLVLVLCILGLLSPLLFGGRMSRLALVRFRAWWILVAALLSQILIIEIFPDADRAFLEGVHMATYVAAGIFVAINWRIPGLLIIAAGGAMNGITIALNGGQLPASREALKMAGIEVAKGDFVNSGVLKDPVLPLLGDIFVWPQPFPFANVFSFGDALIVIGTCYGAHKITGSRLVKKPWQSLEERAEAAAAAEEAAAIAAATGPLHAPTSAPPMSPPAGHSRGGTGAQPATAPRHRAPGRPAVDGAS
ncbi:MAG TPA: DUF5317 family protein [Actinomycetes bacterium]|nr:DUF5317 family protein [Actinomycetes bacterium]